MNLKIYFLFIFLLLYNLSCNQTKQPNSENNQNASLELNKREFEIWQLDYYPDSIFYYRDIYNYSNWNSGYAYNIQFSKDSCQFYGWWESWWNQLIKINDKEYRTIDDSTQFWELKFETPEKLFIRQVTKNRGVIKTFENFPYHRVSKLLSEDSLNQKIAKDIFSDTYKVMYCDTLNCESIVAFDEHFGVTGIKNITKYSFETVIDCDYPVPNVFRLFNETDDHVVELSFEFKGDTLNLKEFKRINDSIGDFDHFDIHKVRIKMLKNNYTQHGQ